MKVPGINSIPSALLKVFLGPLVLSHAHSGSFAVLPPQPVAIETEFILSFVENADPPKALLSFFIGQSIFFYIVKLGFSLPGLLD